MRDTPNCRQNRSLVLAHPQQKAAMHKHHAMRTKEHRSLLGLSFARLIQFLQSVLSIVIAGFIVIFKGKRKTAQRRATEQTVRELNSELEQKKQELEQATQLEDSFISMASHELKTPMTTISGHAQLLLSRLSKQAELSSELAAIRTALERIHRQTHRLNALVDQLLDLNNLRAGKIALRIRACNLVDVCCEVVEEQQFLANRIIELHVPKTPVLLQADYERLIQVLVNLVSNALKYSPEQAQVKVHLEQDDGQALIWVSDTGPGIPEEQQAHLFEPFYRGPEVQYTPKSGLGLGLAICKEVIERHGGRIWCESQFGKGSTFFVELPLYKIQAKVG